MTGRIDRLAEKYYLKSIKCDVSSDSIVSALEKQGYTIVYFNSVSNTDDVRELGRLLGVDEYIRCSKGFTYADANNRIVFVNEDLTEEEKVYVFLHEQGHILCRHFTEGSVMGTDVVQEHEANEFVHYVIHPTASAKFYRSRKPIIITLSVLIVTMIIIALVGAVNQQRSYYGEYYITETGSKYHREGCIFVKNKTNVRRMTKEEFESGKYEACGMCFPE